MTPTLTRSLSLIPLVFAVMASPAAARSCTPAWVPGWASAQMLPSPENMLRDDALPDATLRQVVRVTLAGTRLRLRLSNLAGTKPLRIEGVTIAKPLRSGSPAIDPRTLKEVRFDGQRHVVIPMGAEYVSDVVAMAPAALESVTVSIRYGTDVVEQTSHQGSRATSWLMRGDHLADAHMEGAESFEHWFTLSAVDVETCGHARVVVALGDSITDGRDSTTDGNDRWPDRLADRLRLQAKFKGIAVVNQGIGGNRLLKDGLGPNALARLDRDVLSVPGARYLIVLEGINDIGTLTQHAPATDEAHRLLIERMIGAYRQIIARAHAKGIKVIGGTIMPFGGTAVYHPDAKNEADRQAVNRWIRESGEFDAVIDFDKVTRDPARPDRLLPAYDSGDRLHPSPTGYRAMADAIPLDLFD